MSVSARCVHVSAVHVRVVSWCSPVAQTLLPVARHEVHHTSRARPATHVPALSVHGPDVRVPSSSVYDPAVHFAPGLCTAQPRNPNVSFHAQFRHALADVFCALPHHAPPCCPLHGPAWASPPVPCAAPQCTWPRAVYGLAVQSSRFVACTVPTGTCQPVPCAGPPHNSLLSVTRPLRERLRSFRARLRRTFAGLFRVRPRRALPSCPLHGTKFSARPVHNFARHVQAPSVHGPAVSVPSTSVYGPAVHSAPGLCTAHPRNPNASFHAQFRHAHADLFRALPRQAPFYCPSHGPAMGLASRSEYGHAVHLAPGCVRPCHAIPMPR